MEADNHPTDGLVMLRAPQPGDAQAIYEAVRESLAELQPWLEWAHAEYNMAGTLRWLEHAQLGWENSSRFQFAIIAAENGQFLGGCSVEGIHAKAGSCNLSYWVRTGQRGRGIASRAVRLAVRFAFEKLGLTRAELVIAAGNPASQRAAQKAGAHYEQTLAGGLVVRTDVHDAVIYALTPADFEL